MNRNIDAVPAFVTKGGKARFCAIHSAGVMIRTGDIDCNVDDEFNMLSGGLRAL